MSIFKEVAEDRIEDPTGRLIRLIKFTDGEAREWVPKCKNVTRKTILRSTQNKCILQKGNKELATKKYGDAKSSPFLNKFNSLGAATK